MQIWNWKSQKDEILKNQLLLEFYGVLLDENMYFKSDEVQKAPQVFQNNLCELWK